MAGAQLPPDPIRQVFRRGLHEVLLTQVLPNRLPGEPVSQGGQERHAVAEGLVEGVGFRKVAAPQIGSRLVEEGVAGLVRHHVCARPGVGCLIARGVLEEAQVLAVVVGIQIRAFIGQEIQPPPGVRSRPLLDLLPAQILVGLHRRERRLSGLPEEEVRRTRVVGRSRWPSDVGKPSHPGRAVGTGHLAPHRRSVPGERIVGDEVDGHGRLPLM